MLSLDKEVKIKIRFPEYRVGPEARCQKHSEGGRVRAGNSGGTREPSSQKEFGLAESFYWF